MKTDVVLVPFDYQYLIDHKDVLQNLCEVYCSIWERDKNFGEYRQCPSCKRYYTYGQVELNGLQRCPQCDMLLEKAWLPVSVALDLVDMAKHHSFSGALLMKDREVLGFSWGRLHTVEEMASSWKENFDTVLSLNPEAMFSFHLNELGVLGSERGRGWGRQLVKQVLSKPFCSYPDVIGTLNTHQDSAAVRIYEKLGYVKITDHPAGQGRIRMGIARIRQVMMFK